jgi:hypothetical protein
MSQAMHDCSSRETRIQIGEHEMRKHLGGTPGEQTPDRATPANTKKPAPAVERNRDDSANDRAVTGNDRKTKSGAAASKRKKRFVL